MQPCIDTGVPAWISVIDGYAGSGPACRLMSSTTQPSTACAASGAHETSAASKYFATEYFESFMTVSFHAAAPDCGPLQLNAPALDHEHRRNASRPRRNNAKTSCVHALQSP